MGNDSRPPKSRPPQRDRPPRAGRPPRHDRPPGGEPRGDLVYGIHPAEEALAAGLVLELLLDPRPLREEPAGRPAALAAAARARGIPVRELDRDGLGRLARGGNHQGVAARIRPVPYAPFPAAADGPADAPRTVFALDGVTDVGNFAAMLRSFLALGVDLVLIPADRSVELNEAVHRLSSGASFRLPVARVTNLARALRELKGIGYFVYGADMDGDAPLPAVDFAPRACLVLGSEERGMRPLIREQCDLVFRVPMTGAIESLNVAHAGAIAAYARYASLAPPA